MPRKQGIGRSFKKSSNNTATGSAKTAKKPVEEVDENGSISSSDNGPFVTPLSKRRRILMDATNSTANTSESGTGNSNANNCDPISDILGPDKSDSTVPFVASKIADLLEKVFDKAEDMTQVLDIARAEVEDWTPAEDDGGDGTPVVGPTGLPVKAAKKGVSPVTYNPDIFKSHKHNPAIPVEPNTGSCNQYQCQKTVMAALDFCGSPEHQMFIVHRVLTQESRAGIGLGLGLLKDPNKDAAAMKQTIKSIDDLLHEDDSRVLGSNTNDAAIGFQKTVFVLMAPTAPAERRMPRTKHGNGTRC
jgi:hypothetical protein